MIKYESECCSCAVPGYPCWGSSCPKRHVPHYYCDECGDETDADAIYEVDDKDYCEYCLLKTFQKIL